MNIHSSGSALRRRHEILRIVGETRVRSQEDLQDLLRRRGFRVTQPTLSRDLKELRLVKSADGYLSGGQGPVAVPAGSIAGALRGFVLSIEPAGSVVVVRTPPAGANPVARAIDQAAIEGVVGTIAGDDTLFLATRGPAAASRVIRHLRDILGPGRADRRRRA